MSKGITIQLLVPRRDRSGRIEYHAERRFIRLPLKREDRLALVERLVTR